MKNNILYLIVGVLILGGLFVFIKSQNITQTSQIKETTTSVTPTNQKTFDLIVKERKLISGPEILKVNQGDEVTIKITVDENEEFHLHGYDKSVDLTANQTTELKFTADISGRFPYELEESKTELGLLEVSPK